MSTFAVTVEQLTVEEHPNADRLELAAVGGYRAVVPAGAYRTGDLAVYIPEAAIVPDELLTELGLAGKLSGKAKNRVKAVRLRGELSQGVVCRPAALDAAALQSAYERRTDLSELLGIVKWEPPVPVHMSGDVEPASELLSWVDIENAKRFPQLFADGEPVVATEKVHGTACLATWHAEARQLQISSKGLGAKRLALQPSDTNLYWRVAQRYQFAQVLEELAGELGAVRVGLFGEVYGAGVQDLGYGRAKGAPGFAAFDLAFDRGDGLQEWADPDRFADLVGVVLPVVPQLWRGGYDYGSLCALAEGGEQLSGEQSHLREGVVVRPVRERYAPQVGGRAIVKFVSAAYLTRSGGTEYE